MYLKKGHFFLFLQREENVNKKKDVLYCESAENV